MWVTAMELSASDTYGARICAYQLIRLFQPFVYGVEVRHRLESETDDTEKSKATKCAVAQFVDNER
jgi:hypothetical protein